MKTDKMKDTVLDIINHVYTNHPELHDRLSELLFSHVNIQKSEVDLLLSIHLSTLRKSRSQFKQDYFVLTELNFKKNGYFVDFGATNGININNSYLLETDYDWVGILAEPAVIWHDSLKKNRKCHIETACIWSTSGEVVTFNETAIPDMSTIDKFSANDYVANLRENGTRYDVNTISLLDLLEKYNAPAVIDYLSIDTEGSEYAILQNFDFKKYHINIITCEHNYTPMREKIHDLLTLNNFTRKCQNVSQYDDWYVNNNIIHE